MPTTWLQSLTATPEGMAEYQQERLIVDATERICELMEIQGVSRAELAQRLKKSKSHVSQLLSGRTNMTLRTLSDVFSALGRSLQVADVPLTTGEAAISYRGNPSIPVPCWTENVVWFRPRPSQIEVIPFRSEHYPAIAFDTPTDTRMVS